MGLRALALGWVVMAGAAHAEPRDDLLTLYAQARASDPVLREAAALAQGAGARADVARAPLLPQWQVQAVQQRSSGQPGGTQRSASSQVTQTLLDLASLQSWQAARSEAAGEDARLAAVEQALLARVASAYFALLSAQSQLAVSQANEAAFAELVRQSQVRVDERLSAAVDVDQARAFLGLAQAATQSAHEARRDAAQALQQLTGQPPLPLKPLRSRLQPAPPAPQDASAWVAEALAHNPLLAAAEQGVAASDQRLAAARSAHLPTVALTALTQRAPQGGVPGAAALTQTTVGLQLTVPLFAGGATFAQQRQAAAARDAQAAQHEATRRALVREVQAQLQAATGSVAQMQSAQAAAAAAERALAATRAGQQHGTRSLTDVLAAIQTHGQAQTLLTAARHRHVLALLLLKQAAGRLRVDDLAAVNALLETD